MEMDEWGMFVCQRPQHFRQQSPHFAHNSLQRLESTTLIRIPFG